MQWPKSKRPSRNLNSSWRNRSRQATGLKDLTRIWQGTRKHIIAYDKALGNQITKRDDAIAKVEATTKRLQEAKEEVAKLEAERASLIQANSANGVQ